MPAQSASISARGARRSSRSKATNSSRFAGVAPVVPPNRWSTARHRRAAPVRTAEPPAPGSSKRGLGRSSIYLTLTAIAIVGLGIACA
jgi:hypothetical protein